MRTTLVIGFLTLYSLTFFGQDQISLTFTRPKDFYARANKISILFDEHNITLKNGASTSLNFPLTSPRVIEIKVKATLNKGMSYVLHAIPGEDYTFEVGFDFSGAYINLISGLEDQIVTSRVASDSTYDWRSNLKVSQDGTLGLKAEKTHSSESIRQEWLKKGGKVGSLSIGGNATYFNAKVENYGSINGYGAGFSYFINNFNLKIPTYKPSITSWNSFNWGAGFDIVIYGMKWGFEEELFRMDMSSVMINYMFAGNIGWTVGVGKFRTQEQWKGVAFVFKYKPALNMVMGTSTIKMTSDNPILNSETTSSIDPTFNLNLGGFGFDIQFSNFYSTMQKLAPKPSLKLSVFVLPPVGDNPLFISVGLGIIIYKGGRKAKS